MAGRTIGPLPPSGRAVTTATVARCQQLAADIRELLDPPTCHECAALAVLVDGLVQIARQQMAGPVIEHFLAAALQEIEDAP